MRGLEKEGWEDPGQATGEKLGAIIVRRDMRRIFVIGARALGFLCVAVIFWFLFRALWSNREVLREYSWKLDLPLAVVSFVVLTGSLFLLPWGLKRVLALLGHPVSYRRMCNILFPSLMAKYLPGGWWAFVGRAHFYHKEGISVPHASAAVLIETILVVTSGIFVFALFFLSPSSVWGAQEILLVILGAGCLVLIHPLPLNLLLSVAEKILGRPVVPFRYPYRKIAYPFFIFFLFWLGMGGSFWILAGSLLGMDFSLVPQMMSAFALSWVLGFFSFITPGGLGVREGSLTFLLQPHLPVYAAAALALLSRVWWIGGEVLGLLISYTWERMTRGKHRDTSPADGKVLGLPPSAAEKG